jgi:hypothetical protein
MTNDGLSEEERATFTRLFNGAHARVCTLAGVVHAEAYPALSSAPLIAHLDVTVHGMFLRLLAWSLTLKKLDGVMDFQAHSAGCRSLFEIVVDLVLLTRGVESAEKLIAWEELSTLSQANAAVRDPGSLGIPEAQAFINHNAARLEAAVKRFWPHRKSKNPPLRWTGNGLVNDARAADAAHPLNLARFGHDNYARLCWATHGSGLILVRRIDTRRFPGLATLDLHHSFDLMAKALRLALDHFKLFDATWEQRIQAARQIGSLEGYRRDLEKIAETGEST